MRKLRTKKSIVVLKLHHHLLIPNQHKTGTNNSNVSRTFTTARIDILETTLPFVRTTLSFIEKLHYHHSLDLYFAFCHTINA
jgi:hypothetical protein